MISKERAKGIATGIVLSTVFISTCVFATSYNKQLNAVYNDIKIIVGGQRIIPKDSNGKKVDPFIVDGTTYLPVRAVAEALGRSVTWNQKTKEVIVEDDVLDDNENQDFSFKESLESNIPADWYVNYDEEFNTYDLLENKGLSVSAESFSASLNLDTIIESVGIDIDMLEEIDFDRNANLSEMPPNTYSVIEDENFEMTIFIKYGGDGTFATKVISPGNNYTAVFEVFENMFDEDYEDNYTADIFNKILRLSDHRDW